jgi:glutamyl-tRNA synthetase
MKLPADEFAAAARPYVERAGLPIPTGYSAMAASVQEKVQLLTEVPGAIEFYLSPDLVLDDDALAKARKNSDAARLLTALAAHLAALPDWSEAKEAVAVVAAREGVKPGQLMFPLRVALSGRAAGPALDDILAILGRDESVRRIEETARSL